MTIAEMVATGTIIALTAAVVAMAIYGWVWLIWGPRR